MKNPIKNQNDIEILQSLIQKAVRRGSTDIVRRVILCLVRRGNLEWLTRRATVLVFEECWTHGQQFIHESDQEKLTEQLIRLTRAIKNKNASGLGSLAYQLSLGDETTVVNDSIEKDLRFICIALSEPHPFWEWSNSRVENESQKKLLQHAQKGFMDADQPWDKAFMLAAAYLAVSGNIPETKVSITVTEKFPLWIAIDRHTTLGREKITEAAKQINLEPESALWLAFYFEGALCNEMMPAPWWEKEKIWRMKSLGMTVEEGRQSYDRLKPVLRDMLREEEERLRGVIFN